MTEYIFHDALTGSTLAFEDDCESVAIVETNENPTPTESLFFPGCSFLNYGMAIVDAVYATLEDMGEADGLTLQCCGRILAFEEDGKKRQDYHGQALRDHLVTCGVKRIIAACPNCVKTLRGILAAEEKTADIEVVVLPKLMADLGFQAEPGSIARIVKSKDDALGAGVVLCTHDSCPDRQSGEFAAGMRALLPEDMWVEPAHHHSSSICCGSLARAAGHFDVADRQALENATEALEVKADCLVTACVSCAYQLNMAQNNIPARYIMEFLYEWPLAWEVADQYMKLRFLFEDEVDSTAEGRAFKGLGDKTNADKALELEEEAEAVADKLGLANEESREDFEADKLAAGDVGVSNRDVTTLGE